MVFPDCFRCSHTIAPLFRQGARWLGITWLLALGGCASVTVHNAAMPPGAPPTSQPPTKIYVTKFTVPPAAFHLNKSGAAVTRVEQNTADLLSRQIVSGLNTKVIAAELATPGQKLPKGSWVLRGKFTRVNGGSATLRILIGLGAGGSKMETQAALASVPAANRPAAPFWRFETTGGSGAGTGLITIPLGGPVALPMLVYQIGSTIYSGASKGVGEDTGRTARMIVAAISEEMTRRGFPVRGRPLAPKHDWTAAFRGH